MPGPVLLPPCSIDCDYIHQHTCTGVFSDVVTILALLASFHFCQCGGGKPPMQGFATSMNCVHTESSTNKFNLIPQSKAIPLSNSFWLLVVDGHNPKLRIYTQNCQWLGMSREQMEVVPTSHRYGRVGGTQL